MDPLEQFALRLSAKQQTQIQEIVLQAAAAFLETDTFELPDLKLHPETFDNILPVLLYLNHSIIAKVVETESGKVLKKIK